MTETFLNNVDNSRNQLLEGVPGREDDFRFDGRDSDDGFYLTGSATDADNVGTRDFVANAFKGGNATLTNVDFTEGDEISIFNWDSEMLNGSGPLIIRSFGSLIGLANDLVSDSGPFADFTQAFVTDGNLVLRLAGDGEDGATGQPKQFEEIVIDLGTVDDGGVKKFCLDDVQYVIGDAEDNRIKNHDTKKDQVLTGDAGADDFRFEARDSDDGLYLKPGFEEHGGNATITDLNFGEGDALVFTNWAHTALQDPRNLRVDSVADLQKLIDDLNSDDEADFTGSRNGDPAELKEVTGAAIDDAGNLVIQIADNNGGAHGANFEQIVIENIGGLSGTGSTVLKVDGVQYVTGDGGDNRIKNFDTGHDQVLTGNEGADRFVFSRQDSDDGLYLAPGDTSQGGNATITDLDFGDGDIIVFTDWKHGDLRDHGKTSLTIETEDELTALIDALNTDTSADFLGDNQDATALVGVTEAFASGLDLVLRVADNEGGVQGANFEEIIIEEYGYLIA